MNNKVTLKELLEAGCHFGHQARRWNPKMKQYLYIDRGGVHIFDLVKTRDGLQGAMDYLETLAKNGGQIVFLGTKRQAQGIVKQTAQDLGISYINTRWLGGFLTNYDQIGKRIKKLKDLRQEKAIGKFEKYTKKEQLLIDRQIARLDKFLGGLTELDGLPDAIFVVDTHKEFGAVKEAIQMGIKVVGMVDSNADPDGIDYVIPVNDDAVNSINLIVTKIAEAIAKGLKNKKIVKIEDKPKEEKEKKESKEETKK